MPLKQGPLKKFWSVEQVIAWIGFDIIDAPDNWPVYEWELKKLPNHDKNSVRDVVAVAATELLNSIYTGTIKPEFPRGEPEHDTFAPSKGETNHRHITNILAGVINLAGNPIASARFSRDIILDIWPGEPIELPGTFEADQPSNRGRDVEKDYDGFEEALLERAKALGRSDDGSDWIKRQTNEKLAQVAVAKMTAEGKSNIPGRESARKHVSKMRKEGRIPKQTKNGGN